MAKSLALYETITVPPVTLAFTGSATDVLLGNETFGPAPGGGQAFPVGSVFIAVVSTNPGTLLGYGTWSAFGAGRVLIGLDAGDTDFDVAEEIGGAKTVASTGNVDAPVFTGSALGTHSHGVGTYANAAEATHTHTYTDVVNHVHVENMQSAQTGPNLGWAAGDASTNTPVATGYNTANPTGGVATGTTAAGSSHTHALSGSSEAVTAGTPAGTNTAPAFTGSGTSVVQPYIVVYMWKRTA